MLFLWMACTEPPPPAPVVVAQAPAPAKKAHTPKYTQAELAESADAFTLSGILKCSQSKEGPWTVAVWPFHPEFYGPDPQELPWHSPLVAIELEKAGNFELKVPSGEKRLVLAYKDDGQQQAFADPDGAYLQVQSEVSELVVDCAHSPSWPNGIAPVTEQGKARPVRQALDPAADADWLYTTPSGRRNDGSELRGFEDRRDGYERRFKKDPNAGDIAASLALMPEEAAEEAARNMERR
jgi:hypothetical protein